MNIKTFYSPGSTGNPGLDAPQLPTRLKVLNWGKNPNSQGIPIHVGDKTSTVLPLKQNIQGFKRVAIDFDHCTAPGAETNKKLTAAGQPSLIFGYGDVVVKFGDGIYLENIEWTPLGVQHARNFSDLSPAICDEEGEVTMIHSVALTPNGSIYDLPTFLSQIHPKTLSALSSITSRPNAFSPRKIVTQFQRPRRSLAEILNDEARANGLTMLSAADGQSEIAAHPDAAPKAILLMPWGPQPDPLGYVVVNIETLSMLPKCQSAFDLMRVPILAPTEPPTEVGSGRVRVSDGEGILLEDIQFTDEGLKCLAEYTGFQPTIWIHGDLADGGTKSVYGVKNVTFGGPSGFRMLDFPALINLSAAAMHASHNRMVRALDAQNRGVQGFKNGDDRESLIKLLSAGGKPVLNEDGKQYTATELRGMSIELLKLLAANVYRTGIALLHQSQPKTGSGLTLLSTTSATDSFALDSYASPPGPRDPQLAREWEEKRLAYESHRTPGNIYTPNPFEKNPYL